MTVYTFGLLGAAVTLVVIFEMLRRRKLREKYAVFWVITAVAILIIALFPKVLIWAADLTGVQVPSNLLFFIGSLVLLAVNVQLSSEVGRLEEKVRTLAEELGLQRLRIERLEQAAGSKDAAEPAERAEPAADSKERADGPEERADGSEEPAEGFKERAQGSEERAERPGGTRERTAR